MSRPADSTLRTVRLAPRPSSQLQLSYTRGSAIPCVMVVETTDPQALDLLSAPRSIVVRLLRQIATGAGGASGARLPSLEFERGVHEFATAVWRADDAARRPHVRVLHGEIHLAPGLKPTCRLGTFELSVSTSAIVFPRALVLADCRTSPRLVRRVLAVLGRRVFAESGCVPARRRRGRDPAANCSGDWDGIPTRASAEGLLAPGVRRCKLESF